jgi:hypothetical protein
MYNDQGSITVHNSLFTNNEATAGGAIANRFGSLQIANCTFVGNIATHARGHGGAVYGASTTAVITNSVFWNNFCAGLPDQILGSSSSPPLVTYSNVQGGWTGTGNINVDPAFENAAIGDYRLGSTSPCKNTGSNAALPLDLADLDWDSITINPSEPLPKDLEMRNRRVPVTGNVDMGAYERPPLGYGGGGGGGQ